MGNSKQKCCDATLVTLGMCGKQFYLASYHPNVAYVITIF